MVTMNPTSLLEFLGKGLVMLKEKYYHPKTSYLR
jgi:hypothetical protein